MEWSWKKGGGEDCCAVWNGGGAGIYPLNQESEPLARGCFLAFHRHRIACVGVAYFPLNREASRRILGFSFQ